ncbi:hypothetical protein P691DRAFT_809045 [Macrolepiota fuliginosa MF-IS2]|uniref:Uncharacterized protein n=1 Tax=Macrolepiota fuliginosa MF-IS2 TaxID=1400762 RepID=A0A9P5XKU8_9AGAR|nr:hypothetical protein P691DRAFT_809045 [Macrolepiota fuliginosa MF-IS2]
MPTQVQKRPSTADGVQSPRTTVDKFPPIDPMHSSHDSRAKFNLQHREALRLALGSILAPKRPSMSNSRSSSGTASPAYSFSGSGTYTPATPPIAPYTPSLDAQDHPYSRLHPLQHYHPPHPPSKLGRLESHPDAPETDAAAPIPMSCSPPLHHLPPPHAPPPPLFRGRSQTTSTSASSSTNPSPRTSPRLQPSTPPTVHTPSAITTTDTADLEPSLGPPVPPVATTSSGDPGKISVVETAQSTSMSGDTPVPTAVVTQAQTTTTATATAVASPDPQCQGGSGHGGAGTPRAKFIQTLQGKSAWDALIHGSFS